MLAFHRQLNTVLVYVLLETAYSLDTIRMGLCRRSRTCCILIFWMLIVRCASAEDSCTSKLPFNPNFDMTGFKCEVTWSDYNYVLRSLLNTSTNVLSVLVSAQQSNQWVALGFSEDGMMVGSTAMVAWKSPTCGTPLVYQYYLQEASPDGVIRSNTTLSLLTTPMAALDGNGTLYWAFQVNLTKSSAKTNFTLYAIGPEGVLPAADDILSHHIDIQVLPSSF